MATKKLLAAVKKGGKHFSNLIQKKTMLVVCVCMYVGTEERA